MISQIDLCWATITAKIASTAPIAQLSEINHKRSF